ncbi:pectin acetylesterase 11-like isoform X2 [Salvia miltiorrhiza]|uniref:pectin acetylesterase 11-like isoform X2 n=1 Tax=Salvia miltiorrhiza TaxID=226208 RepID=UPI0025ABEC93|nr:pectin acetylesterase 11-like isoform X2 [Salvia miltiorrhiza]
MAQFVLLIIFIFIFSLQSCGVDGARNISITLLKNALAKGAVCLDGSPPAYAYSRGFGDGADNWHVYLQGGGWCDSRGSCLDRSKNEYGSSTVIMATKNGTITFRGMLADNSTFNPDFYNWNVVYIFYCDGSSFMSDIEEVHNLTYRGGRIYEAMMDELLRMGMGNAKNALLSGTSAGGLATILHCDKFQALFPDSTRVKCLSDSGFFIRGQYFTGADLREGRFYGVVKTNKLENLLPTSCTTKFNPILCFFPENLVKDVQTPLFLIESAFDQFQLSENVFNGKSLSPSWYNCTQIDLMLCNWTDLQTMKDFRTTFIQTLKSTIVDSSSRRGYFVHSCYRHGHITENFYSTCSSLFGNNILANKIVAQAVGDWYFDRSKFEEIDILNDLPRKCSFC